MSSWLKVFCLLSLIISFLTVGCDSDTVTINPSEPNHLTWMTDNHFYLKDKPLADIVLPGSHDSGMSLSHNCYEGDSCNTQAQVHDILGQLQRGVRYLDIRPTWLDGHSVERWYTAHGTSCDDSWRGCMGQSGVDVFKDIHEYVSGLNSSNKELIIVNISHCYEITGHTTVGHCSDCDDSHWEDFIKLGLFYLSDYMLKCPEDFSVESTSYDTLMKGGGNIIFRVEHGSIPTDYSGGIINANDFPIYDHYSNTLSLDGMISDQGCKLQNPENHDKQLFLLSWTLTLDATQAVLCTKSIIHHAKDAKPHLKPQFESWIGKGYINASSLPNIIYTDAVDGTGTDVAIDINKTTLKPPPDYPMGYYVLYDWDLEVFGSATCYGRHTDYDQGVDMAATPTGRGYWILTEWGGINCYGDAKYYGHHSHTGVKFKAIAATPTGKGYWLMSESGGINCYGDAVYYGHHSGGGHDFNAIAATPTGKGYWLMSDTGGINCYGDAVYYGHHSGDDTFVDIGVSPSGKGYYLLNQDGGINCYGDAQFYGHSETENNNAEAIAVIGDTQ